MTATPWDSAQIYPQGAIVSFNGIPYQSLAPGNFGNTPDTNPRWWGSQTPEWYPISRPSIVNAQDPAYGAKGDGVANDTNALQAALSRSGLVTYVPNGTYRITTKLSVPDNSYVLFGDNATLLVDADMDGAIVNADQVNGNSNIHIDGGNVNGQKAARTPGQKCRGFYFVKVTQLRVHDFTINQTEDHGVHLNDCDNAYIARGLFQDCGLNDTSVGGSGIAYTIVNPDKVIITEQCIARRSFRAGFRTASVGAGVPVRAPIVHIGCTAEDAGVDTATPEGSPGFSLQGDGTANPISGAGFYGCHAIRCGDGIRFAAGVKGCVIDGGDYTFNDGSGISFSQAVSKCNVTGAIVANNSQSGAGTFDGIRLEDTATGCTYNTFTGIIAYDDQGVKTQGYGINELNNSNRNVIIGGEFSGNLTGPWSILGTNTRLKGAGYDAALASVTAAATISTRGYQDGEFIRLLGSTTITAIESSHPGKRMTFQTASGLTILGTVLGAGGIATFISDHLGTTWVKVA